MIDTRLQWLKELERISNVIHGYGLSGTLKDVTYVDRTGTKPDFLDKDAYSVANSEPHNLIVSESVDALQDKMPEPAIRALLGELTFRKTYGAFSELIAYKWFGDAGVSFSGQVPATKLEVVNPNGSTLDGEVTLADGAMSYFDVKGFGFIAHKIKLLQERLEDKLIGHNVLIEGDWNLSIDAVQDLHETGFSTLLAELKTAGKATRAPLQFRAQKQQRVMISAHAVNPFKLAQANRDYPLRFAAQYARNKPFMLVFVIHPWFSQGDLHQNFGNFVDRFTEELARLAFLSFAQDQTQEMGMARAELMRLLSGLVFLNGWPPEGTDAPRPKPFCRIFLNGEAKHKLKVSRFAEFKKTFGDGVTVKRISRPLGLAGIATAVTVAVVIVGICGYFALGR